MDDELYNVFTDVFGHVGTPNRQVRFFNDFLSLANVALVGRVAFGQDFSRIIVSVGFYRI